MKIACMLTPMSERNLLLASQVGVEEIVCHYPGLNLEDLRRIRDRVARNGMRLTTIERLIPHDAIVHNLPGRATQVEGFKTLIRNMGSVGLKTLCYNWMPNDDWHRTRQDLPERGGALVTGFKSSEMNPEGNSNPSCKSKNRTSAEQLWNNLERFLKEIIPVAEDSGINLALHPDDPPLPVFNGQEQIITSVEALEKAANLVRSDRNGICFCQGSLASAGDRSIPKAIEQLAPYIKFIHFRDVIGAVPDFRETFHDNGKTNMARCWKTYEKMGLENIPIRPDHVPTMAGESNTHPGYEMLGRLFAVGYMRGLQHAATET
jgi:mannonate dehydratase